MAGTSYRTSHKTNALPYASCQSSVSPLAAFFKLDTSGIDDGDQFQQQLLTNLLNCSVTVKANRRVTFAFYDGTAHDVNLEDYH